MDHMTESVQSRSNQMQNERDRLRMVLNSMVEGVIAVDAAQRVIFFNTAASRLFKLREPASIGRPLWELVRHPRMQQWVAQALDRTEPVGGEMEMLDPVARILVVNVARFPVQPQFGAVVVVGDVTELRRLERIRQEFVANASHELKTPLASIKACVETLLDGASDDPKFRTKFLQSIDEQTDRLDELVRDMLTLARVESDALASEPRPISVNEVAEVSLGRHLQAAERKQVKMSAPEAAEPIVVLADEEALEQILDNLLDNAIKYTNPGGTVTLRLRAEDTQGVLEVEDTGIGIPHNQLPRIFERFYRVDRHRSRDIGGTGLGLSIVKHLVQAMGGSVSVASRLHQGTTFTVRLPLAARHA
jgi:two-component system phosphate regulon sensor histidine kinase PhoR